MTFLLLAHIVAALFAPLIMRIGRRGFLVLALVPTVAFIWVVSHLPQVYAGEIPTETITWIPQLGLNFTFRLDVLSWVMALLVSGVGALVLVYCSPYFARHAAALGRFGAVFVAFAGAMFGLVTTDNTIALYVFWEATTVFSFLLIGHHHERQASRRAAHQAIILTTMGGLAMLAGLVMLALVRGGSTSLAQLVASARAGTLAPDQPGILTACIVLLLIGAASKSALVPTHFWLPAAMAAPTPVSAYLHAAAMVKAGVYLVARFAPAFAATAIWQVLVLGLGLVTMIVGGYRALRQYDIKLLLAFGTISQLGMMIAIVGYGTPAMMLAGCAMIVAHALFKSALFLTVGVIDWSVGTRDLRELSGLGRRLPLLATGAAIATASMIGLPPFAGYVAKEAALGALVDQVATGSVRDLAALTAFGLGSILTFAYGLRFYWGAFARKPAVETPPGHAITPLIQTPPIFLASLALIGLVPGVVEAGLQPIAQIPAANPLTTPGAPNRELITGSGGLLSAPGHLTLWGGWTWPTVITGVIIVAGVALFVARSHVSAFQRRVAFLPDPDHSFRRSEQAIENFAATLTS
ncbi:MAG: proton-conducting transporter membrane subunit [Bowdeniella nasicola]|nr:proton-conducting transporter membrane subunit [Bowdeniella nasicola]